LNISDTLVQKLSGSIICELLLILRLNIRICQNYGHTDVRSKLTELSIE